MTRSRSFRWQPALAGALAIALIAAFVAVPPLRAAASQFLDIFRVRSITLVQVDPAKMANLEGFQQQIFTNAQLPKGKAQPVASAAEASKAAGFTVQTPGALPAGFGQPSEFTVEPGGHAQATVDLNAARALLQMAGVPTEGVIPTDRSSLDVSAEIKPVVTQHYSANGKDLTIVQGISPDVNVPSDVNLAKIGEAGLELMGMSQADARQFAGKIDWATTLVLPIPKNVASVKQVQVAGQPAYLITESGPVAGAPKSLVPKAPAPAQALPSGERPARPAAVESISSAGPHLALIWQKGNVTYLVDGNVDAGTLQQVADGLK